MQEFEAHQALAREYRTQHAAMPPSPCALLDKSVGRRHPSTMPRAALPTVPCKALRPIFEDVDMLLTFSAPGAAPKGLASTGEARFNRLWTLDGVPCINIPAYVA